MDALWIFLTAALVMWPSTFILAVVLFRQKLQRHTFELILCSVLMALVSLLLQSFNLQYLLTTVQPGAFIMCLYFFFRIRFFYSVMMAVITYIFSSTIEISFYLLLSFFNGNDFIDLFRHHVILPAIVMSIMNFLLTIMLYRLRIGFSVIPVTHKFDQWNDQSKQKMKLILVTGMASLVCICLAVFVWGKWVEITIFAIVTVLIVALYFLYQRELRE